MDQKSDLREKLTQLQDELNRSETLDEGTLELLQGLHKNIGDLLTHTSVQEAPQYAPLLLQLRKNLAQFESTHPRLTAAMERAIDALVQMGV